MKKALYLVFILTLPWMLAAKQVVPALEAPPAPTAPPGVQLEAPPAPTAPPGVELEAPPEPIAPQAAEGTGMPVVDHANPVAVVEAIFEAARTGRFALLEGLCDPMGQADGDVQRICIVAVDTEIGPEFVEWFQNGRVTGEATIAGVEAQVPFLFGPAGDQAETMNLIQRDGLWYLMSF